jgi:hypothetical protein
MEAITFTMGCARRDHFGERPMATPTGNVQRRPISMAPTVRNKVAPAARSSPPQALRDTWLSRSPVSQRPIRTRTPTIRPMKIPAFLVLPLFPFAARPPHHKEKKKGEGRPALTLLFLATPQAAHGQRGVSTF